MDDSDSAEDGIPYVDEIYDMDTETLKSVLQRLQADAASAQDSQKKRRAV